MTQTPRSSGLSSDLVGELLDRAQQAAHRAYAPYSGFHVGAALLIDDGSEAKRIVTGCNVENASFRLTTCAEQAAIVSAVALYGPKLRIRAIAVANRNNAPSQPCGACRQTILEFSTADTWVFFPAAGGEIGSCSIVDLLPAGFVLRET